MNFGLFLLALRARSGLFIVVLCTTVLSAAAVSLTMDKSYRATASLLIDVKDEQSLNAALQPLMMRQEMVGYLQTQTDIIRSEKVARRVVGDLGLARDPLLIREFEESADGKAKNGSLEDWLVESLNQGLEVETSQSNVIRIIYTAEDPKLCASIANAFANAYIATVLELRVEPARETAFWFDEQLKSLRANLEDAQAKLTDYHRANGIISAEEREDVEHAQLDALSGQLSASREQAALWSAKEQQAREAMAQGGSSVEKLPEVSGNPLVQKLKEDLLRGEARLRQLSTQYGVNHPQYERLASENEALRQKLDAETKNLVAGIGAVARLSRQHEQELVRAMGAQRSRVLELKGDRNELTVLRRNAESAEHAYDAAMQRFVVSLVDSRANQTNISVLNPAHEPLKPYRPKVFQNIVLASGVGVMLGIGLVLLIELFDRRVRARSDLDLGVPLLAVINAWQPSGGGMLGRPRRVRALPGQG